MFCLILSLAFFFSAFAQSTPNTANDAIYVKIHNDAGIQLSYPLDTAQYPQLMPLIPIFDDYGVHEVRQICNCITNSDFYNLYRVMYSSGNSPFQFQKELSQFQFIEFTQPVYIKTALMTPDDPLLSNQYHVDLSNAIEAFAIHTGGAKIAVVDGAFLTGHEDLFDNIIYAQDVADMDTDVNPPLSSPNPLDYYLWDHGTVMAGAAGARTDNGKGIASFGWNNQLLLFKAIEDATTAPRSFKFSNEAICEAICQNPDVINLSFGDPGGVDDLEYMAIKEANDKGIIVVAGAGNEIQGLPFYPAAWGEGVSSLPNEVYDRSLVISTAAIDENNDRSIWFPGAIGSNLGNWVDISTYGTDILVPDWTPNWSTSEYDYEIGTSVSSALLSGAFGLLKSYRPNLPSSEIKHCMVTSANPDIYDPNTNPSNIPNTLGSGRLDIKKALQCLSDCTGEPVATILPSNTRICPNGSVLLTANLGTAYEWSISETTRSISVQSAGTYSVTVTFDGGCTASTEIEIKAARTTIEFFPIEESGYPNDGNLCTGDEGDLLVSPYGSAYNWSIPGHIALHNPAPIYALTGITNPMTVPYAVTVTDMDGCTGVNASGVFDITHYPYPPPANILMTDNSGTSQNDGTICLGDQATLESTNTGVSYAWGTILDGQPFSTDQTVTVSPTQPTNYYLTITNAGGCSTTASQLINVVGCSTDCDCSTLAYNPDFYIMDGERASQLPIPWGSLANACIEVQGQFIWDINTPISELNFIMQEAAEILVEPTFTFDALNCNFRGCLTMWKGITGEYGRQCTISLDNCLLYGAQYAVQISGASSLRVKNCTFEHNYVGIYVPDFYPFNSVSTVDISNNTFSSLYYPFPPYSGQTPDPGSNGFAAFQIHKQMVPFEILGGNQMTSLRNGVLSFESAVHVVNSTVDLLIASQCPKDANDNCIFTNSYIDCLSGRAVYAANNLETYVAGNTLNAKIAVEAIRSNAVIKDNIINNYAEPSDTYCDPSGFYDRGILIGEAQNREITIHNNNVSVYHQAIQLNTMLGVAELTVSDNIINFFVPANNWQPRAIACQDADRGVFDNNTATNYTGRPDIVGMALNNCEHLLVEDNDMINFASSYIVEGGMDKKIAYNDATSFFGIFLPHTAFRVSDSEDRYCLNTTGAQQEYGFHYSGISWTEFQCNEIGDAGEHGLFLELGTNFGVQQHFAPPTYAATPNANKWNGAYGGFGAFFPSTDPVTEIPGNHFLVRNNTYEHPTWATGLGAMQGNWFRFPQTNPPPVNCPLLCSVNTVPWGRGYQALNFVENEALKSNAEEVAQEENMENVRSWSDKQRLFRRLKNNNDLLAQSAVVSDFYHNNDQAALGQLYGLRLALSDLFQSSPELNSLQEELENQSALIGEYRTTGSGDLTTLQESYAQTAEAYQAAWSSWNGAFEASASALSDDIEAISCPNIACTNEKRFFELVLGNGLYGGHVPAESVLDELKAIAALCPEEGGLVVYDARSLCTYFDPTWSGYTDCGAQERGGNIGAAKIEGDFTLLPNPSSDGRINILLKDPFEQPTILRVYNSLGKLKFTSNIAPQITALNVNTTELPVGLYFVQLSDASTGALIGQKSFTVTK